MFRRNLSKYASTQRTKTSSSRTTRGTSAYTGLHTKQANLLLRPPIHSHSNNPTTTNLRFPSFDPPSIESVEGLDAPEMDAGAV